MANTKDLKELARERPDVGELGELYSDAITRRDSNVWTRNQVNYNTRYCIWSGQSLDGRKWTAKKGKSVFPWPGASDARVLLTDLLINEDVAKLMMVWRRMRIMVAGVESQDAEFATRLTQILRWMKYTQMTEARRETRLLANIYLERGAAALGVFWERTSQLGYQTIDRESLAVLAMQAQAQPEVPVIAGADNATLALLPTLLLDPTQDENTGTILQAILPGLKPGRARAMAKELRENGEANYPQPYVVRDRPTIVALALNEDLFLPCDATGIQEASEVFRRELLTETALRERVISHGWKTDWVNEMIQTQRGRITTDLNYPTIRQRASSLLGLTARTHWNTDRLFEVVHAYTRRGDADGVPGIYYTVFAPGIKDSAAWHGLLNYDHGEMPFILFERENRSRVPDDARGYGEVAATWQNQVKAEWDARIDRTSLATLPPAYHPPGLAPDEWGPGAMISTMRPDAYGFMTGPKYDLGSKEVEETVSRFAFRYFGRLVDEQNTVESQAMQQELAENWMAGHAQADRQVLQLMQQFMPDSFYYRVVGSNQGKGIHTTRQEIQGAFDITVGFTMSDLIPEQVEAKLGLLEKALQMDVTGRIDRNEALAVVFELIDPNLGERLLRPAAEAAQAEIDDEDTTFARMFAGIPQDVRPGQAYDLRLQRLNQILSQNPDATQRAQNDPQFRENVERRMKQLQFQLQQRENARIGVLGA